MIYATAVLAVLATASAFSFEGLAHNRAYYEAKFVDFMKEHSVRARDGAHFIEMLQKFATNVDTIEKHNASGAKWTMAVNQFAHMSYDEWKAHVNLGLARPNHEAAPQMHQVNGTSTPSEVDWVTNGAVTPVKDQGQCGSCWSFSATGALEGAYQLKTGTLESFSEQNLVSCDNFKGSPRGTDMGCNGGLMDNAFKWVTKNEGLCTEADYPYTSGTTQQNGDCLASDCTKVAAVTPSTYTDVAESDEDMMSALAQQPVAVAIQADQPAFQFYAGGVMTGSCGAQLDHGVLAVGYGTYEDGQDYYKVKNSWGAGWGMDGYILLGRGSDYGKAGQCGILSGPPSYPTL